MSVAVEAPLRLITAEEALRIQRPGPWELVRGKVVDRMPAGDEHGTVVGNLAAYVGGFIKAHRLGKVLGAETGVVIERGPDTVRAPDFAFVAASRVPEGPRKGWVKVVPDLLVEVWSEWDRRPEVEAKIAGWLRAGVRIVWEVDPFRRVVVVHKPGEQPQTLTVGDVLSGEDMLPEFSLPIENVFE